MTKDAVEEITIQAGDKSVSLNPGLYINNQYVPSISGKKFPTINPATGEVICEIYEADTADIDAAVAAAEKAYYGGWKTTSSAERGRLLSNMAKLIIENADELARVEALDNGKTFKKAQAVDVRATAQAFSYYGGWATKRHGKTLDIDSETFAYTRHEPIGVCGAIIPWNFPLLMLSWKVAPALACGNVSVLKSSEKTPLSALLIAKLFREAGFPPGVVNIVSGYGPTAGNAISSHMRIRKVAFTGSTATGKRVMEAAARSNLKKVSLELGGKSPNIIFDDCDLKLALRSSVGGLLNNAGQVCAAGTRIFVQEGIYDEFVKGFTAACQKVTLGDQFDPKTRQGPQIDKIQFDNILKRIQTGVDQGATVATGGKPSGEEGYFIQPTVFTDATDEMQITREEIFGPVGVILKFKTEEEVIKRANDTEYGLASAVFTQDLNRAIRVSNALEAGTVWVNKYGGSGIQCTFGGVKQSGIGRECGEYALELYTQVKQVVINVSKM